MPGSLENQIVLEQERVNVDSTPKNKTWSWIKDNPTGLGLAGLIVTVALAGWASLDSSFDRIEGRFDNVQEEFHQVRTEMSTQFGSVREELGEVKKEVNEMNRGIGEIKSSIAKERVEETTKLVHIDP